ncbi:MAG: S41 family peptidase [Elusimicrobiales bacterium]
MRKRAVVLACFFLVFSCQKKGYDKNQLTVALLNHSYYSLSQDEVKRLVDEGPSAIKKIDKNFEIVYLKGKKVREKNGFRNEKVFYYPFVLKKDKDRYLIAKVFDYTIAYEAGLKNGILKKIDDASPDPDPCRLAEYISKKESLLLSYNDGRADWRLVVKKEMNVFPFVWSMMLDSDTAYINIVSLSKNSSTYFKNNVMNLINRGVKKLIIDLRDVSAGNYDEVANIISYFSKDSKNYFIRSSKEGYSRKFDVSQSPFKNMDVSVVVDKKTSLLGEIIAQSLKEWGAFVVGEKTSGNIYITKMFKLAHNAAAQITIAKLYPPSGKDMDDGITPDVNVSYTGYKKYSVNYVIDCDVAVMKAFELLSHH